MKTDSKQFPVSSKNTIWALYYGNQKIIHGTYALCAWKKKQMIKDGLKAKEMKIIVEEVKTVKQK